MNDRPHKHFVFADLLHMRMSLEQIPQFLVWAFGEELSQNGGSVMELLHNWNELHPENVCAAEETICGSLKKMIDLWEKSL